LARGSYVHVDIEWSKPDVPGKGHLPMTWKLEASKEPAPANIRIPTLLLSLQVQADSSIM
jgi:hypothetical protein